LTARLEHIQAGHAARTHGLILIFSILDGEWALAMFSPDGSRRGLQSFKIRTLERRPLE